MKRLIERFVIRLGETDDVGLRVRRSQLRRHQREGRCSEHCRCAVANLMPTITSPQRQSSPHCNSSALKERLVNRVYSPQDVMRSVEATRKEPISRWVVKLIRMVCALRPRGARPAKLSTAAWPNDHKERTCLRGLHPFSMEECMHDPQDLRGLARKCRMMTKPSLRPSVNEQLWLWVAELADYADEVQRSSEGSQSCSAAIAKERE